MGLDRLFLSLEVALTSPASYSDARPQTTEWAPPVTNR